jgi:hypothetical protein
MRARDLGTLLLAIWLIATGLITILHLSFTGMDIVMAVVAIAAGVLILIRR